MLPAWTTSATKLVAMGWLALGMPPQVIEVPFLTLLQSVCHPVLHARNTCSSAAWMLPG